jgi:hydroxypyruvate reductase
MGVEPLLLSDALEGEARLLARQHAELAKDLQSKGKRSVLLSGGEATVYVKGSGHGGPNQEYALALAIALDEQPGIWALAADTDGNDGGIGAASDPAGAVIGPDTLARAREAGLDPNLFLENNDSTGFFSVLGDLLITGPTFTNVNDFRAILVEP